MYVLLPCVFVGGLYFTIRNKGMQFTKFGHAMKNTIGKVFQKQEAGEGAVTPFQAVTTALAATVGIGNLSQANSITDSVNQAISSFFPAAAQMEGTISLIVGIILAVCTALALFGGIKRIGKVTELLVHFMSIFYILFTLIVICTLTGLTIVVSGIPIEFGVKPGSEMITNAFATVFGDKFASLFVAVALILFAFSTILGWALYGSRCIEYLFGLKATKVYQIIFILMVVVGATISLDVVWDVADTFNGLMAIPNFFALFALSGTVVKLTKEYFSKQTPTLKK